MSKYCKQATYNATAHRCIFHGFYDTVVGCSAQISIEKMGPRSLPEVAKEYLECPKTAILSDV